MFAVLRRHRGTLAGATVRVVGLSGLTGLLTTAAIFALARPVVTRMRNQRIWHHHVEDPYDAYGEASAHGNGLPARPDVFPCAIPGFRIPG